jgi:hypothetical protein
MNRVRANFAKLTRQTQARWAGFWRWYRAAGHRTQIALGIGTLMGVFVLSSLAVAAFRAGAHPSGTAHTASAPSSVTHALTATPTPRSTHIHSVPPRPTADPIKHGHGHHKSPRMGQVTGGYHRCAAATPHGKHGPRPSSPIA